MKKVLLIMPHSPSHLSESRYVSPSPGIIRLASFINAYGHKAEYFDPNLADIDPEKTNLDLIVKKEKWDIIGFSCLQETLINDIENMWRVKKLSPDSLFIAGGIEAQNNYQTIFEKSPCKVVILGEGEYPLLALCNDISLNMIDGIVFIKEPIPMNDLEFENATSKIRWEKIDYESYWKYYEDKYGDNISETVKDQIYTIRVFVRSRCPFRCKFCSSTNQLDGAKISEIEPEKLTDIIACIIKHHPKVRTIYLTDDDFCLNRKYVISFCRNIIQKGLNKITYMCFSRIKDIDSLLLLEMKEAGFRRLNIGIESFSEPVLQEIGKNISVFEIIEKIDIIKNIGIEAFFTLMLVTPGSTVQDIILTINLIAEYIDDPLFTFGLSMSVRATRGSEFYEMYNDFETDIFNINGSEKNNTKDRILKQENIIYATDPLVKQIQILYREREKDFMDWYIKRNNIVHGTYTNMAKGCILLMRKCIDEVMIRNNKRTISWEKPL